MAATVIRLLILVSAKYLVFGEQQVIFLHSNDVTGRFTDTSPTTGGFCGIKLVKRHECIGGLSRVLAMVTKFRDASEKGDIPPSFYLFSGGIFTGSIYYTLWKGQICSEIINRLNPDGMTVGKYEFHDGDSMLKDFLDRLNSRMVATNIDASRDIRFQELEAYGMLKAGSINIGVIGYVNPTPYARFKSPLLRFRGRYSITRMAEKLHRIGMDFIILLSSDNFESEKRFAREVPYLDLVIGGGSEEFLWNAELEAPPNDRVVEDSYPVVVRAITAGRRERLVVRVPFHAHYLGILNLTLDDDGSILEYAGQPIYLANHFPGDRDWDDHLKQVYGDKVTRYQNTHYTNTKVFLTGGGKECYMQECNLGNLFADAYAWHASAGIPAYPMWSYYSAAIIAGSSIKQSIDAHGDNDLITRIALMEAHPIGDKICLVSVTGSQLFQILELSTRTTASEDIFPQVSGLRIAIDLGKPDGHKLMSVRIRTSNCKVPRYEDLIYNKTYNIVSSKWMIRYHPVMHQHIWGREVCEQGVGDLKIIQNYLKTMNKSHFVLEGRIKVYRSVPTSARPTCWPQTLLYLALLVFLLADIRRW